MLRACRPLSVYTGVYWLFQVVKRKVYTRFLHRTRTQCCAQIQPITTSYGVADHLLRGVCCNLLAPVYLLVHPAHKTISKCDSTRSPALSLLSFGEIANKLVPEMVLYPRNMQSP